MAHGSTRGGAQLPMIPMTFSTLGQPERVVDTIRAAAADTEEDMAEVARGQGRDPQCPRTPRLEAQRCLRGSTDEDTQARWADTLASDPDEMGEGEEAATADVEGLRASSKTISGK